MANNYLRFSEMISNLTDAEKKWWVDTIDAIESSLEDQGSLEGPEWQWLDSSFIEQNHIDFSWAMEHDVIFFFAEESGNPEQVCNLVQRFLQLFRPEETFSLQWAEYCDKPRAGEFGGGAAAVTKDTISWLSTSSWLDNEYEAIQAQAR